MKVRFPVILILVTILAWLSLPLGAEAAYLGNITFDKATTSYLDNETVVNITIDYKIDEAAGCYIWARPYTLGSPTPNYAASASVLYPTGTGVATQYFRIASGDYTVTHVRIFMKTADQNQTLLELFVPVHFVYSDCGVFNLQMSHNEHDRLRYGTDITIDFDYGTDETNPVRIYARPFTDGNLTPGYTASGSIALPPDGSYSQYFSFDADADVTDIRFQIYNEDNSELLATFFYPFEVYWREWGITNIEFDWAQDSSLHNSQDLTSSFIYDHQETGNFYVWTRCITDGDYTPGSYNQASAAEPPGPHPVTRYCCVYNGEQYVDAIRFRGGRVDENYFSFDVPVDYHWAPHAVQNPVFVPASPAILSYDEPVNIDFDYMTDDANGVRIFCRAAYQNEPLYGMTSAGSPLYPYPGGIGDFWLTYNSETMANQIRFHMTNADQSVQHLEHFYEGWWAWGPSHLITDAPEQPIMANMLGVNYPNPFNPITTVPVTLTDDTRVRLAVYDLRGRLVRELHDGRLPAGQHAFTFDGRGLASGVYMCRLETPEKVQAQRMVMIK